jgi:cell division protein FtsQ
MNRKKKDVGRIIRFWMTTIAIVGGILYLFVNPQFRIKSVKVIGAETVDPQAIIATAHVPIGSNIFLALLTHRIPKNAMKQPEVATAMAGPLLPGTVVIRVTERRPYALFAANGQHWLMDKDGIPYKLFPESEANPGLPVLAYTGVLPAGEPVLGHPMSESWLKNAYQLIGLVKATNNLSIQKITVDQSANLCLNRQDNLQIKLGQPDSLPFKVAVAQATLSADDGLIARQAAYIDISSPDQPVWLPKSAVPNGKNLDGTVSGNTSQ